MLRSFGYGLEDAVDRYSVFGGIPKYLWYLKNKEEFKTQIKSLFFDEFSPLKEEGKNLLIGEFGSEHPGYFSILEKTGYFDRDIKEIADRTGMEKTKVMKYITELSDYYGIIEKVENKLSSSKRGARYRIRDNFLNFWFKYIYSNQDKIEFNPEAAFDFAVKNIPEFIGRMFEEIIKSILPYLYNAELIPFYPETVGKHWGKIPGSKEVYEIDAVCESKDAVLLIECKWRNRKASKNDIINFLRKCGYINDSRKKVPVFISKSGFEDGVFTAVSEIIKIDLNDIEKAILTEV
jgi:AAA+ ATPase superfamily predicted ATPase